MNVQKVLILNTGSSSLKWSVLDAATERVEQTDDVSWHDSEPGRHAEEIRKALTGLSGLSAAGHRVVHGGARFREAVVVDDGVLKGIEDLAPLAPLHNPAALAGIEAVTQAFPGLPQVAAFDTAFHATIPDAAATYALPREWTERWALRRYGFHGLSVAYAVRRTREMLGALPRRLAVCHLGSGCSVTAVLDGRSIDTSMGFTPLEGLVMGTRSGTVDPGLLLYLLDTAGVAVRDLDTILNDKAGLLGLSGVSNDLRKVEAAAATGDPHAALAVAVFVHSLVRTVGAMAGVLGGLDAVVLTGGIGEHSVSVRGALLGTLSYLGLALDQTANAAARTDDRIVTAPGSVAQALVITAREDLSVLAAVRHLLDGA